MPTQTTAVGRVRRYQEWPGQARARSAQGVPMVRHRIQADSLSPACRTIWRRPIWRSAAPIRRCDFTRDRRLPILTVDEPIYRRLPAFLIATVDKFASLPWVGETGAFFGHVDRFDEELGFYGAAEPGAKDGRSTMAGRSIRRT